MYANEWRLFLGIPTSDGAHESQDRAPAAAQPLTAVDREFPNDMAQADALGLAEHHAAISAYENLLSSSGSELPADESWKVALALCSRALGMSSIGEYKAAAEACDELLKICAESSIPFSLGLKSIAENLKRDVEHRMASGDDAGERFQAVLASFGSEQSEIMAGLVAKGLVEKGVALLGTASNEAAQQALDSAAERLVGTGTEELRYWAVRTLLDKSLTLRDENRSEEALPVVDRALEWLADEDRAVQSALPLRTMLLRATLLDEAGQEAEAFRVFSEVDCVAVKRELPDEDTLTMEARGAMNSILLRVTLLIHPNPGTTESEDIQLWSERELPIRLETIELCRQAGEALSTKRPAEAVKFSTKLLKRAPMSLARARIEAHWIRAMGRLNLDQYDQRYDQRLVERDITHALGLLTRFESTTLHAIRILSGMTSRLGSERILQLVQDSPSSKLLVLLRLSLERELGREPSVPAEAGELLDALVEEVVMCREAIAATANVRHSEASANSTGADDAPKRKPSNRRRRLAKARRRPWRR